jgi:hypothetical protein
MNMSISRSQTPVSISGAAEEAFRPTQAHELTPYSSPLTLAGKKVTRLDVSVLYLPSLCNEDEGEMPNICYFPATSSRRISCVPEESSWGWGDGDVTPPLSPKSTIQVVSPAADRYKRKRQDEEEEEERIARNSNSNNNNKTTCVTCPTSTSLKEAFSLESLLSRLQRNQKKLKPQGIPTFPNLRGISRSSSDHDILASSLDNSGDNNRFEANTLEQAAAYLALPPAFGTTIASNHIHECLRSELRKSSS